MAYLVLARKFRPKNFDEIIGQEHISQTLKNAIFENRIAHAYLFSGPRGCGKTSMARIFAKALNCKNGPTVEPCETCENCLEISKSSSIDVLEIDGASNNGIDEIRIIRENVKFSSANSKYKIYIIDEAHQITSQAFNALLKTLEEPPPHVIFILATTEQYKIPVTILSRCQRYRFKLIPSNKMSMAIKNIGYKDGFEIDNEALNIVTTASCGSMRDALSLLDQAVSLSAGKVTGESIRELLGLLPKDVIASITENIAKNDIHAILRTIKEITEQGYNISQFSRDLRDHLRRIMIYSINPEIIEISSEDKKLFDTQKELFSIARHVRMNNLLSKALEEMRWYDQPKILIEMYLLKISEPYYDIGELINRLAELEKSVKEDINLRSSFVGQSLAKEEKIVATSKIFASIDLMNVWHEIISEITKKHLIIAQSLKKAFIKIINISSIQLTVTRRLDYESILEFKDQILKLFEKKTGLNITIEVVVDKKKNIFKNDIEQRENVIFKEENFTKTQQTTVPKYIEEIAKKFDSTAKKI